MLQFNHLPFAPSPALEHERPVATPGEVVTDSRPCPGPVPVVKRFWRLSARLTLVDVPGPALVTSRLMVCVSPTITLALLRVLITPMSAALALGVTVTGRVAVLLPGVVSGKFGLTDDTVTLLVTDPPAVLETRNCVTGVVAPTARGAAAV